MRPAHDRPLRSSFRLALGLAMACLACACNGRRTAAGLRSDLAPPTTVVPNDNTTARGDGASSTLITDVARTYMLGIASSQLTGIPVGAAINGLSVRISAFRLNDESWPRGNQSFDACKIEIGPAAPLAKWKRTLADNFAAVPTLVRRGPMAIPPATFTSDPDLPAPAANPFGDFFWAFQEPFTYEGGDLAILVTHLGAGGSPIFFDARTADPAAGWTAYTASGYEAETGAPTAFTIVRLHHGFGSGCPGAGGATPNLVLSPPARGSSVAKLALTNAPPRAGASFFLGIERAAIDLPSGCTLLTTPAVFVPLTLDGSGRALVELALPAEPRPALALQAFVLDASVPAGFTLTNGVELPATNP